MRHQVTRQAKTMMTRKITIIALIAGIVLGAAATGGFNAYRRSQDSQIFQQRVHCKAVADAYVKENSTDFKKDPNPSVGVTVTLDKADYSPARNSCVAEFDRTDDFGRAMLERFSVQDLLSGETLFSVRSDEDKDYEGSWEMWGDRAFDYVMKNASETHELREAYYQFQKYRDEPGNPIPDSKHPPFSSAPDAPASRHKSASPSGRILIDPVTGERVPITPPKSAPPFGRSN